MVLFFFLSIVLLLVVMGVCQFCIEVTRNSKELIGLHFILAIVNFLAMLGIVSLILLATIMLFAEVLKSLA